MEINNTVTAPQLADVTRYYEKWKTSHAGSLRAFLDFMTTPSSERDNFVSSLGPVIKFNGSVATVTLP